MTLLLLFLFALVQIIHAQTVITRNRNGGTQQQLNNGNNMATKSPFLSTTLSTKITYNSPSSDFFDTTRKDLFTESLTSFLTKIFVDQQMYAVKIISVNIFDDHILKNGRAVDTTGANAAANEQKHHIWNTNKSAKPQSQSFTTVVSAEYTSASQMDSISNESFRNMLVHVVTKFQDHLLQYLTDADDWFGDVGSIELADFQRYTSQGSAGGGQGATNEDENKVLGMSNEMMNLASIVAIVVGSVVFVVLSLATVRYYRKATQLKLERYHSKEMSSLNGGPTLSSTNSPDGLVHATHPIMDDYSFTPQGSSSGMCNAGIGSLPPPFTNYRDDPTNTQVHTNTGSLTDEDGFSSVWPEVAPPQSLFTTSNNPVAVSPPPKPKLPSYTEQLQSLPKQHAFAPPGKIGVALDVINGQPVVHKIKKGSPLESMLRPNDVVVAIDDVDTSCMSAADVTSLMVKRMDRVRKITFVRR